ncbi:MAG: 50S ribosomal protein L25 [Deltaproteobacteria bacterium CG_4_10_14_3_um_filter_60_8]|nr:MAG: hypothetical protein AUK28_10315 [Desulfobacterales bacterium CG2_30_60_27]PIY21166.1 MAG: 50S ribosomal protein L25 [Deltaproteobacteria bacterium CG_4_10_14_3_um_filter_60_8]
MIQVDLTATMRDRFGKGAARTMRRQGRTPAVLYGPKAGVVALDLETKGFSTTLIKLQRRNAVINLTVLDKDGKGGVRHAMIKELQTDPVQDTLVHADFLEIPMDVPMILRVPVKLVGKAKGADLGGEVMVNLATVKMKGLVLDIPDYLEVDVSPLEVGDSITCKNLDIPKNVTLLEDGDKVFVHVAMPSRAPLEEEGAGEPAAAEAGKKTAAAPAAEAKAEA